MRLTRYPGLTLFIVLAAFLTTPLQAQLHFEGLIFDGMNRPLLENASSVDISPDGAHVYSASYGDNAISVFDRNVTAPPSSGMLSFIETKKNGIDGVEGLSGAFSLVVSPDGRHVYAAGSLDNSVVVFSRDQLSGSLTYLTNYSNGTNGIYGITGAYYIDMPPDGNHVYVTGPDDNSVAVFRRNVITGELTLIQVLEDQSGGVNDLNYPLALTISPDGKNVYITSFGDYALNVFSRNLDTGELTFMEAHKENQGPINSLEGAYGVAVSPDGKHVLVTSQDDSALTVFERELTTGELTYIAAYFDGQDGVSGISGSTMVSISADGNYVYANGTNDDALAIFSRDTETGGLLHLSTTYNGSNGISGMGYPLVMTPSRDGMNMYVAGFGSASIVTFEIDENTGALNFLDNETGAGMGISGLDGATAAVVSPDGNNLYAAGNNADALLVFNRNSQSGMLDYVQKFEDGAATDGLNGINAIIVSDDGEHVYATSFWDKTVVLFNRDLSDGTLTYVEQYKDDLGGIDGLNGANDIFISPDGNHVYVTGFWEHALAVFSRNTGNGKLTFLQVFKDGVSGVNGLNRASAVKVSPDGKHVYVAGHFDNAIAIFSRNTTNGTLTYLGIIQDGSNGVDGLDRVNSLVLSPDGLQLYATGFNDDAIAVFNRDSNDGSLTYITNLKNGVNGVTGMNGPSRVCISNTGERIYVSSSNDNALVAFNRNPDDGSITFENTVFNTNTGVNGLSGVQNVTVSPDDKHIYTSANIDHAIAIFSCTYFITNNTTICEGESVAIGGNVYNETGTYTDTIGAGGCKAIVTLELKVHPASTVIDAEICNGDSYTVGNSSYNTTGTHVTQLVSSAVCDSTVTLNLTVVDAFENINADAEICHGASYIFGSQTLTASGTYEETFTTAFGCDSTVILDLTVKPAIETTLNEDICQGDFYVFGTQNYISEGTFVKTFSAVSGCDSTVTLNLTVHSLYATISESICEGNGFELGNEIYYDAGTYIVFVESPAGCETEVTLHLAVEPTPSSSITEEICEGESYTFAGENITLSGVYTNSFPVQNGCDSIVTLNLTVHTTSTYLDETICEGESFEYAGDIYSTSGDWEFTYTATSGCGDSTVFLSLIVESSESILDITICEGGSYTLGDQTYTQSGTYFDDILTDAGCEVSVTLNLSISENEVVELEETICSGESFTVGNMTYSESGSFTTTLSSSLGCDSTVNLTLFVLPPIETTETIIDNTGGNNGSITINVSGGTAPYEFLWSNGATTQNISQLNGGVYTLTITDAIGCENVLTYTVGGITGLAAQPELPFDLLIYPNPVNRGGVATLEFDVQSNHRIILTVYDGIGKSVHKESFETGTGKANRLVRVPTMPGLYLIQILSDDGSGKTFEIAVQ